MSTQRQPQRAISRQIGFDLPAPLRALSLAELRDWHQRGLAAWRAGQTPGGATSWLAIKQALAQRLLQQCNFCVHDCRVDRSQGQQGYCRLGSASPLAGSYLHHGEEPPIRPTWALFFSGCTMHCSYCHNWRETFHFDAQQAFPMAQVIQDLQQARGQYKTLSLIGGTPEPHLHTVLDLALQLPPEISAPLVLNHNATLSAEGLDLMAGVIDIYLPDFKHGNNACAWQLTKIQGYTESVLANLRAARDQQAGVLVRHLVLPGHLDCCTRPVLAQLAGEFKSLALNVMFQYRPMYKAEQQAGINRRLQASERETVRQWVSELKLSLVTPI